MVRSICVFCGSRHGERSSFRASAERLGERCGQHGVDVVYGGGHVGLMGVLADAAMGSGGTVVGFIPERLLAREVGHRSISELIVTDSMFDRKDRMIETADAFVVLPGGLGTLDELFEVLTLRQLGYHQKPIILVNVDGFWDPFASLVDQVVRHDFADSEVRGMLQTVDDVDDVLPALGLSECRTSQRADLA